MRAGGLSFESGREVLGFSENDISCDNIKIFNNELIKQIFKFYKNNKSFNDEP